LGIYGSSSLTVVHPVFGRTVLLTGAGGVGGGAFAFGAFGVFGALGAFDAFGAQAGGGGPAVAPAAPGGGHWPVTTTVEPGMTYGS